jgi:hypothetical protein
VNVGSVGALIVMLIVAVVAHTGDALELGVNVYVDDPTVAVDTTEGLQVPAMPLSDVKERVPGVSF